MRKIIACLLALSFVLGGFPAHAGYAQLKPPPGWSQGMGAAVPGVAGKFAFGVAANASSFRGTTVLTNAALNVAGSMVTVPVGMRVAANAAVEAASWSFGNPLLFVAALALPVAYDHYKKLGLQVQGGKWVKINESINCANGTCTEWKAPYTGAGWEKSADSAGSGYAASLNSGQSSYTYSLKSCGGSSCIIDYKGKMNDQGMNYTGVNGESVVNLEVRTLPETTSGTVVPISDPEFHAIADPVPLPSGMPQEMPVPLPVEQPAINPDPNFTPSTNPASRPLWVPTGDPVKNPNSNPGTNPDTWTQPGVRVTPSPTATDPWRVDVIPEDKTKEDSSPNVEAEPVVTSPKPEAEPAKPLCELFPDIVACAKLGNAPEPTQVPNVNKPVTITKDSGWGPENGTCPAPRVLNLHGLTVSMPWDLYCQFASGIRPIVLGLAYLGAAFTFFGIGRKS